ncbi:Kinase, TKL LISK [Spironucleus salmonicida]|uniref:Kinase, TKL LISK n=1 Tax=Spironucleus salmonicida TaxID=348837 RepID=V6LCM4_9EUKA|nr:Kinase, TKL LISK [Spironucleus salmonicida]|eukprot:EST42230.1 Kinase, TKL LISK [Spironucleus salmonicida]
MLSSQVCTQLVPELITIKQLLGSGFYSEVYEGVYKNKSVAIKIMNSSQTPEMMERELYFNQLSHPNIAKIYGWYQKDDKFYIVMELCSGGAISEILDFITDEIRVRILYQSALGLYFMHQNQMVHRDLKIQNVLLKKKINRDISQVQTKISDFGLARKLTLDLEKTELDRTTSRYTTVGTPLLMAPEILINDSVYNEQVDIFMFGLMILELFRQCTDPDIIRDQYFGIKSDEISKMNLPIQLKAIVIKCCETDPQARLRSEHLVKALKSLDNYYNAN